MGLKNTIDDDLKVALLARKADVVTTLRGLKAAVLAVEVAEGKRDPGLSDAEVEKVVAKEIKKRRESVDLYLVNGRQELADGELLEISVLEKYLPEQLSEEKIAEIIDSVLMSLGEGEVTNMGVVMGRVKGEIGSGADMGVVSRMVKERMENK
jgi:uncharacterized protein YqeY